MAKIVTEKQIRSFVKGLITEASPLTFPENSSIDEENFVLELNGSRSRRLGIDYETEYALTSTGIATAILQSTRKSCHSWYFPGGSSDVVLGVIRVFNRLYFVNSEIQTAVVNGYFILVGEDLPYPIILEYNKDTDVVTQAQLVISIRDLDGIDDDLASDERPTTL